MTRFRAPASAGHKYMAAPSTTVDTLVSHHGRQRHDAGQPNDRGDDMDGSNPAGRFTSQNHCAELLVKVEKIIWPRDADIKAEAERVRTEVMALENDDARKAERGKALAASEGVPTWLAPT